MFYKFHMMEIILFIIYFQFYCHLSSGKTFRTIPEVVNFIMFGPDQTKTSRKRTTASDDETLASASKVSY